MRERGRGGGDGRRPEVGGDEGVVRHRNDVEDLEAEVALMDMGEPPRFVKPGDDPRLDALIAQVRAVQRKSESLFVEDLRPAPGMTPGRGARSASVKGKAKGARPWKTWVIAVATLGIVGGPIAMLVLGRARHDERAHGEATPRPRVEAPATAPAGLDASADPSAALGAAPSADPSAAPSVVPSATRKAGPASPSLKAASPGPTGALVPAPAPAPAPAPVPSLRATAPAVMHDPAMND